MTEYDIEPFEYANSLAREIESQNNRYTKAAHFGRRDSAVNEQNRIALEQEEYLQLLEELTSDLPYEEVTRQLLDREKQLQSCLNQMEVGFNPVITAQILAINALASKLALECYPHLTEVIEENAERRIADLRESEQASEEEREASLLGELEEIDGMYKTIGSAWPVPIAKIIPVEHQNGIETPRRDSLSSVTDEFFEIPQLADREPVTDRVWEHIIDQPDASELITLYLLEHAPRWVLPEEIAEFVYSDTEGENRDPKVLKVRVMTILGPKTQAERIKRHLAKYGHDLEHGWREIEVSPNGSTPRSSKRRVYRAVARSKTRA